MSLGSQRYRRFQKHYTFSVNWDTTKYTQSCCFIFLDDLGGPACPHDRGPGSHLPTVTCFSVIKHPRTQRTRQQPSHLLVFWWVGTLGRAQPSGSQTVLPQLLEAAVREGLRGWEVTWDGLGPYSRVPCSPRCGLPGRTTHIRVRGGRASWDDGRGRADPCDQDSGVRPSRGHSLLVKGRHRANRDSGAGD